MLLAVALLISAPIAVIAGQTGSTEVLLSEPREARLEKLLSAEDWLELGQMLKSPKDQPEFDADLMWLRQKTLDGKSAFLSLTYGSGLWYMASSIKDERQKRAIQSTSLLMHLYAISATNIDGTQCVDKTAPSNRIDQIMRYTPEIWDFAASLSDEERTQILDYVVEIEQTTAPKRLASGDAKFLCMGGMSQISFGLANGTTREVPPEPGQFGRQIKVDDGGKYVPEVIAKEEWGKVATERRAGLRNAIETLLLASKKQAVD
jgi:hypothetical protein